MNTSKLKKCPSPSLTSEHAEHFLQTNEHNSQLAFVEKVAIALVGEYLYKKNFRTTLKNLHVEPGAFPGISNRRAPLAEILRLESFLKQNKKIQKAGGEENALDSMLEVLVKVFLDNSASILKNASSRSVGSQTMFPTTSVTFPLVVEHDDRYTSHFNLIHKQVQTETGLTGPVTTNVHSQTEVRDNSDISVTYSTSDFLDPEQVASPPLSSLTHSEMSSHHDSGSRSRGIGSRTLSASKSPTRESRDEKDNEDGSFATNDPSPDMSPPSEPAQKSFDTEFQLKRPTIQPKISSVADSNFTSNQNKGTISLAESMLQSKQNILAQGCLSAGEIQKRNKARRRSLSEDSHRMDIQKMGRAVKLGGSQQASADSEKLDTMELCDIEDEDLGFGDSGSESQQNKSAAGLHVRHLPKHAQQTSQLELGMWRKLKVATGLVQDGWMGQGFSFSADVPFGLLQNKGGPCGVLAVVQALILRNLMFGSKFSKDIPIARNEVLSTLQSDGKIYSSSKVYSILTSKRSEALCATLVEILWRCVPESEKTACVKICLKGNEPGSELIEIRDFEDLEIFVRDNCYRFDCLGLVYSAVLTRGPDRIQEDMDFPDSPLIGQHGYCSLELINLLLFGKCISNVFDNEVALDGKTLKGIPSQSDIGFLSLFEHYGSCEVGLFMKNPKYPVWIICSESHFSIFFSPSLDIVSRDKEHNVFNNGFDIFYYDGLARQQQIIRLTICFASADQEHRDTMKGTLLTLPSNFSGISSSAVDGVDSDHLIPPLEKCIRTKWKNAKVFWNGTEPLL